MDYRELLGPACSDDPNAREFAAVLAKHLPAWAHELRDYAWDTAIPPRDEWETVAEELARHLETL